MSSKRRGRANGGGRRQGRGGGGRGKGGGGGDGRPSCKHQASGSRKGSDECWDYGDDFCVFDRAKDVDSVPSVNKGNERTRPGNKAKMPLQTLHMTSENQKRVKELLRELQGQDLPAGSEVLASGGDDCDEPDHLDDEQSFSENEFASKTTTSASFQPPLNHISETEVSSFAVNKLSRYGFDGERCQAVLKSYNGNIGASLEHLLLQCFSEKFGQRMQITEKAAQTSIENCLEQRQEEAFALSSICGDKFVERIQNKVWTVMLNLTYLTVILSQSKRRNGNSNNGLKSASLEVCKHYLRGDCRFGSKCRFKHERSHQQQGLPSIKEDAHLRMNIPVYELEIRFPEGNKYPYQPPLVAFYSTNENLPLACRLHIAEFLYEKALTASESNEPVVYAFVTCLEDEAEVTKLLTKTSHRYSVPPLLTTPLARMPADVDKRALSNSSCVSYQNSEATKELVLEEEEEDGEEPQRVHVESESYVNFKKSLLRRCSTEAMATGKEIAKICKQFSLKKSSRHYQAMLQERQKLPAWEERKTILSLLNKHQVLVVSGMTGCGKTTQIPQFILDSSLEGPPSNVANIICTQPRRISAISVAERVAKERMERIGVTVGYQIRLESVKSSATRLVYCTTGVLLRRLEGNLTLQGVTHVIVDEVHERTGESDFLLLVLKDIMVQRPDLRIILMSATLNAELFSQYFNSCPVVNIPGRTFPVDQFFLEDAIAMTGYVLEHGSPYMRSSKKQPGQKPQARHVRTAAEEVEEDLRHAGLLQSTDVGRFKDSDPDQQLTFHQLLIRYKGLRTSALKTMASMDLDKINLELIEALLEWIVSGSHSYPPGAVLIFLPGLEEIKTLYKQLQFNALFNNRHSKRCLVYPLHSSLSSEEQQCVFLKPPEGVTKIIISTNIAETSITIDDVVYVIDSGKMKEKRFDPSKGMESLEETFVSKVNAVQRKGRAGRVASGVCFHLFTSHHYNHLLSKQQLPEIQRVPLEQLCLRIKILEMFSTQSLHSVLSRLIEPPTGESLRASKVRLQDVGALMSDEKLTPLGYHLASLPVDVGIGKLMLFGTIFRCLDPALTIAASRTYKTPFVSPWNKREEAFIKKLEFAVGNSDYLALLQAYKGWSLASREGCQASFNFCRQNFLSESTFQEMARLKRQFTELLSDIGFVKEGLRAKEIERKWSHRGDGVLDATGEEANANSENVKLISAILCAALYPNVVQVKIPDGKYQKTSAGAVKMKPKPGELKFVTKNEGYVHIHPSSVNYQTRHFESPYLVYHEKIKTSRVFIRDCSMVSVYPLILFGGGRINVYLQKNEFVVSLDDGWIRFVAASHQVAELVKELRSELDQLLQDKIKNPSMDLFTCPRGSRIISMIVKLVTTQ
ncbi:putative ATP-dependent RNA helicase DHX57 [Sphaerodactylus townsendi]|uniref:putative ATP-dependent RNA helicase DHX57 n=1 Tax=Sphaerodactylus townsendi TaxID=933632 RepID=UPI0020275AB2|nr:putative ATP-dependent RNA helicase DHX57 [Sphaerodactylus townsendi]XP_048337707.1 putative ATP-dependent RNA helicase DHX57 [Sphaerodactylus townsendi]XP_048337716.1 putative ATP-dependent RNA helicase DHX57 [Sphaerodactylus townsendi]XP_048337725.1 putative ATP-dependent RNA helicase DHX57 [Sphaerodactylus townsendi]